MKFETPALTPVSDVGDHRPPVQAAGKTPKSLVIWTSGDSPLRAISTTSRPNYSGYASDKLKIHSIENEKLMAQMSVKSWADPNAGHSGGLGGVNRE